MLNIRSRAAFATCLLCFASMSAIAQDDTTERLRLHGSNTVGTHLMPALVQSWLEAMGYESISQRATSPHLTEIYATRDDVPLIVEIEKRGSTAGIADLIEGNTELAIMARRPNAQEIDSAWQLGDLGSPDQEFVVALDAITAIVNALHGVRFRRLLQG